MQSGTQGGAEGLTPAQKWSSAVQLLGARGDVEAMHKWVFMAVKIETKAAEKERQDESGQLLLVTCRALSDEEEGMRHVNKRFKTRD